MCTSKPLIPAGRLSRKAGCKETISRWASARTRSRNLHRRDGGRRTGVGRESGEGREEAGLLDVPAGKTGGEVSLARWGGGRRDELRAVGELADVVAKDGHLAEGSLECGLELSLVV